jgi:hypothetical protein
VGPLGVRGVVVAPQIDHESVIVREACVLAAAQFRGAAAFAASPLGPRQCLDAAALADVKAPHTYLLA